ncbi:MAG: hypothetical protein GEU97_15635 [Actinophytocola sp.]|nr:hypothetical protein [Actinophytocola sp.]
MFTGVGEALGIITTPQGLLILTAGALVGLVFAVIPGIAGVNAMAILLPFTFVMDQAQAMVFLVAIMASGGFAGSITSILLNVPGEPVNAATTLDGYPMSRQGKAGVAIAASATASALGSLIGLLLLIASIPILRELVLFFGPPELFAFAVAGIALIGSATGGSQFKGLIAGACGMLLGAIGYNTITGEVRYTGGALELYDGVPLIAAVVGLFAVPELYKLMRADESVARTGALVSGGVGTGIREVLRRPGLLTRSSVIGTGLGMIPGVGGSIASWIAYFAGRRTSRSPETFGKGNIEGVIAPDSTLTAKEGGSMMPVLALGLPGSLSTAILLSAFLLHGVTPGQRMFDQHMDLVWAMIITMALVNLLISGVGLLITNQLVKITLVPARTLAPVVLVLVLLGAYVERQAFASILIALAFGLLGIAMTRLDYPRAALLVGMILFPIAEDNFHLSLRIFRGSYEFLLRPITFAVLLIVAIAIVVPYAWRHWMRPRMRARQRVPAGDVPTTATGVGGIGEAGEHLDSLPDTLAAGTVAVGGAVLVVASFGYSPDARFFPLIVLTVIIALAAWLTGSGIRDLTRRPRPPRPGRTPEAEEEHSESGGNPGCPLQRRTETSVVATFAWILALPVLMWTLGAVVAIFVYTALFMLGYRPRRPRLGEVATSLVIAAILTGVAAFGFQDLLGIQLPAGEVIQFSY